MVKSKKFLIVISSLLVIFLVGVILFNVYPDKQNNRTSETGSTITHTSSLLETYENKIMSIESQEGEDLTSLNKAKKLYESILDSIEKDSKSVKESDLDNLNNLKKKVENKIDSINLKISKLSTAADNSDKKDETSSNKNTSGKKPSTTSSRKPTPSSKPTTSSKPTKYDDPPYGTAVSTMPKGNYSTWGWRCVTTTYEWKIDEYGGWWSASSTTSISSSDMEEWGKYGWPLMNSFEPKYEGKIGEKYTYSVWVWLEK